MDDKTIEFPAAQAGQPVEPSQGEAQPKGTPDAGLTDERILTVVKTAIAEFSREQQSARDKMEARLRKEVQSQIDTLKATGVEVTPQIAQAIHTKTAERIAAEQPEQVSSPVPAQARREEPPATNQEDTINQAASEIMQEYGVVINEADPEAKMIDMSSPRKFLATLEKAAQQKQQRMTQQNQRRADAQVPVVTGGGNSNLMAAYQAEVKQNRGNIRAITQIQSKYRKLGLQI